MHKKFNQLYRSSPVFHLVSVQSIIFQTENLHLSSSELTIVDMYRSLKFHKNRATRQTN